MNPSQRILSQSLRIIGAEARPRAAIRLRLRPLHETGVGCRQDDPPERDPVPHERNEVVVRDVAEQATDDKESAHERGHEAYADHRQITALQQVAVPYELVAGRREERRDGEEEREFGRRRARQAEQHAADDRRTRARRPRDQREGLRDADLERVGPAHVVDAVDAHGAWVASLTTLRPQDHECANDERARDRHWRKQSRLDRAAEGEPEHGGGKKRDQQVEDEALRATVTEDACRHRQELDAILPADGEDRAGLNDDLEELRLFSRVAKERSGNDQMPGAGDGEKFGEPLDDAEDRSGEQVGVGHLGTWAAKKAGQLKAIRRRDCNRSSALAERGQRLRDQVGVIGRQLAVRRQMIDDLRQHLREPRTCISVRQTQLLGDLTDRTAAENFLQLAARDRLLRPGADPRPDLIRQAAMLELADDAGQAAVLLDDLQRHRDQRARSLLYAAAEYTTQQAIQKSHRLLPKRTRNQSKP